MINNGDAIQQLGHKIGLPLKFNSNGICDLVFDDHIEVFLEGDADKSVLHINGIIDVVRGDEAAVYRALLVSNYNGQATGAAALSMHPDNSEIVLTQTIDVNLINVDQFASTLETFVKYTAFWIDYLPKSTLGSAPGSRSGSGSGPSQSDHGATASEIGENFIRV